MVSKRFRTFTKPYLPSGVRYKALKSDPKPASERRDSAGKPRTTGTAAALANGMMNGFYATETAATANGPVNTASKGTGSGKKSKNKA